jgi:hypothetical protein
MQIHHIDPAAVGGSGDYDNGIPVCLDCHAEIESHSNMGRRFTAAELTLHRDRWFEVVQTRPEVLMRASRTDNQTGPLEAMLAELNFNRLAVSGPLDEAFPPLVEKQFERAIAANALVALPGSTREAVYRVYRLVRLVNARFTEMVAIDRSRAVIPGVFRAAEDERKKERAQLVELLPRVIQQLENALGLHPEDAKS